LWMMQSNVQACPSAHGLRNEPHLIQIKVVNQRQQIIFE